MTCRRHFARIECRQKRLLFWEDVFAGATMDSTILKQLILRYMEGWITGNREQILSTLDPACLVIECYGPTYRAKRWLVDGLTPGLLQAIVSIAGRSLHSTLQMRPASSSGSLRVHMRAPRAA